MFSCDGLKVWHQVDARFPFPKVEIAVKIASACCYTSARSTVLTLLVGSMLADCLTETVYMADMAGLQVGVL